MWGFLGSGCLSAHTVRNRAVGARGRRVLELSENLGLDVGVLESLRSTSTVTESGCRGQQALHTPLPWHPRSLRHGQCPPQGAQCTIAKRVTLVLVVAGATANASSTYKQSPTTNPKTAVVVAFHHRIRSGSRASPHLRGFLEAVLLPPDGLQGHHSLRLRGFVGLAAFSCTSKKHSG